MYILFTVVRVMDVPKVLPYFFLIDNARSINLLLILLL